MVSEKGKPKQYRDKVLMIDARNVYRKVTRKIYDFSPEQLKNLTSIVWLYRGQPERFLALIAEHLSNAVAEAEGAEAPLNSFTKEAKRGSRKSPGSSKQWPTSGGKPLSPS